jgi:nucleotide-binding universal stress UspA family protein
MSMLRGPVLVGTNLTPEAEGALREAAALARDLGERLIVCHVMPELLRIGMLFPQWRGVDPSLVDAMTTKARDAVSRQLESILGDPPLLTEVALDSGTPHTGVLAQAASTGAGVIVVGPGEVALQVARHAPVPVLVARPSPPGCVVGATDFSDPSLETLRVAAAEARRRHVPLHLVFALDVGFRPPGSPTAAQPYLEGLAGVALDGVDELRTAADERLTALLRDFGVEGRTAVVSGHAESAIVGYAESVGAGLVVVGRHGGSGFAQLTLGSTATGVIESAPCSVLVSRISAPASLRVAADTGRATNSVATF